MLTPTGISASDYINAIKAGNPTHARLTFSNQNIVLEDEDITSEGIEIKSYLNGDIDLTLGKAIMTEVTASLFRNSKTQDLQWMDEFTLEFGVDVDEEENGVVVTNTYWVTVGYFTGDRPERSVLDNVIQFTAHDRMKKFDVIADDYLRTLTFSAQNPISLSTIYSGLCTYCGVASESNCPILWAERSQSLLSRTME